MTCFLNLFINHPVLEYRSNMRCGDKKEKHNTVVREGFAGGKVRKPFVNGVMCDFAE